MESKPSRIPRRLSAQPSGSRSARIGAGSGGTSLTDSYHTRESSLRLDSGCQESSRLHSSNRDWAIEERETYENSWKLPASSPTHYSGTLDCPWSGRLLGSRNRLLASSSSLPASSWFGESERTQGAYSSRLHNQQQDIDSKRPKLSYTSTSSMRSSGLNTVSDSPWRYSDVPRSSSMVLGSLTTELVRERRELERTEPSVSFVDYSQRNGDFPSSSYLQERPASSYAQGARPKENSLSSLRLNTSMNRQLPSERESSLLSRDHSWNSRSNYVPREVETSERNIQPEFAHGTMRSGTRTSSNSEGVLPSQRSLSEPPADTEGRRTTRQLLSRLASSMSSTFFSRRSGQDSLNSSRPLGSEGVSIIRAQASAQATSSNTPTISESTEAQTPDGSQGFSFLRRRWGLAGISPNPSADSEAGSYRHNSESRNAGSWLSSSLRNRCTPLFSRRRREGRDETARTSTSETSARSLHLFRRRESVGDAPLEAQRESLRPRPSAPAVPSGTTSVASESDSVPPRRNSGISGMFPGSLFRFAVPPTLGNNLSDNVMITVDIIPSSWNQPNGQDNDKSKIPPSRDPERLQKIKESLLSEDSEEEEGDLCRICQMSSTSATNLLIEPCKCTGSLQYVHQECMKKWLQSKINSGSSLEAVTTCELCKEKLHLNLDNFDIHELHRAHANEQADYEFISSGLYLVVLLHLCEQRFSDMLGTTSEANTRVRFINLARTLQAHMDDIETASDDDDSEDGDLDRTLDAA
ncbi:E3 ubiquitin-protein ligase MARCH7 isoform X1 [Python bivittatus]|uniref:RING-type E3 ubiquitin transferase n=1 Tax=Python bivittatus TaxID=176946 RepID=A0A9F5IU28_PYTBI|nr:E3 ubiquitin-protein ligase MARCH7 isoform X1 [Python bivittatus]XP_007423116.1 E3 ubiquitin-protein ligase MARCH7 isoform X1 [Python bivittatus]XP_007423117.1 E3 ubiquitin-protein ligase MARCH7 isoform X1 [Python bivittatus]XP_015747061.1 E3 ubiquitin-protein ligase MARCH7 isoform X1 [Python bivittatus]XP_025019066.1 E3 ubiquitin-protein ligase MARCH7 isoform X1 [Python bivittatus]XP_025019067.1 E3 ubiquitin-protein ligase MARCH7 isoform X1 [Python bivittatus]